VFQVFCASVRKRDMRILFIKITSTALVGFFLLFLLFTRQELGGHDRQKKMADYWKQQVAKTQLEIAFIKNKHSIFQQEVALLIPGAVNGSPKAGELRSLASIIPREKMPLNFELGPKELLAEGKKQVVAREFEGGTERLQRLIENYPSSFYQIEAQYLIIEAQFNQGNHDKVVDGVNRMVDLFPENRLTGYALLRLGGVFESRDRLEEALKVYRTILFSFPEEKSLVDLASQHVDLLEL